MVKRLVSDIVMMILSFKVRVLKAQAFMSGIGFRGTWHLL